MSDTTYQIFQDGQTAWFRISRLWVTEARGSCRPVRGQISVRTASCAGGDQPPRIKLAGAAVAQGQAA